MERKINTCGVFLLATFLILSSGLKAANASPIRLADSELDTVSAGYVELVITANAAAAGSNIVVTAHANSNLRSNRGGRTIVRGDGLAQAIGDLVYTETGYRLNTDETIVSLNMIQRIRNSDTGTITIRTRINRQGRVTVRTSYREPRNNRGRSRGNGNRQNGVVTETNTLRVRAVITNKR